MISYWERKNFINYDFIVVGAGIVGLSTAIHLKVKFPNQTVLVLERGIFPSGASSRNAGFACFGSLTEILDDLHSLKEEEVLELVARRYSGLTEIRQVFGEEALDYEALGGFELIRAQEEHCLEEMGRINELLKPLFGEDVFALVDGYEKFRFSKEVKAVVKNRFEGQLDSGRFLKALWAKSQQLGIQVLTGAEVTAIERAEGIVRVTNHIYQNTIEFQAKRILVCTNAFSTQLVPDLEIKPGRGMVMVSKPLENMPWQGAFHVDRGYTYFRSVDNRLLIGGGRNIDVEGEGTSAFGINEKIKAHLLQITRETIFPDRPVEFEMEWSGIMAFGSNKKPIIQKLDDNTGVAIRMGGMGVAIGWQAAKELVNLFGEP